jgi:hypothetical protein
MSDQLHALAALARGKITLYPTDRRPGGLRAGMDAVEKKNISYSCRGSNPHSLVVQPASQKERDHLEDQDVGAWTILKCILER